MITKKTSNVSNPLLLRIKGKVWGGPIGAEPGTPSFRKAGIFMLKSIGTFTLLSNSLTGKFPHCFIGKQNYISSLQDLNPGQLFSKLVS